MMATGNETGWINTWPGNEWEFKLNDDPDSAWTPVAFWTPGTAPVPDTLSLSFAYLGSGTSGAYKIRMPVPPINVLIIRHHEALISPFGATDGSIVFNPTFTFGPCPEHPDGYRYWNWSGKGISTPASTADYYGLAVTLKVALDRYFDDMPYVKGTVWDEGVKEWKTAGQGDMELAPLSKCEDSEDKGTTGAPITDLAQYDGHTNVFWADLETATGTVSTQVFILSGNTKNEVWDGDKRLEDKGKWGKRGEPCPPYTECGVLSPFDINNNGWVERPDASDPGADNWAKEHDLDDQPYTKARVLKHTITHEIIHALAGKEHSKGSECVFFHKTNNWKRDDYLDDTIRSKVMIHNKKRCFQVSQ
jgi:hypothetical protein